MLAQTGMMATGYSVEVLVAKLLARVRDGIIITHDPEIATLAEEVLPIGEPLANMTVAGRMD